MKNSKQLSMLFGLSCILWAHAGCGGGTMSTSGGGFDSGFDSTVRIADLPDKDAAALCQRADQYFERVLPDKNLCQLFVVATLTADDKSELAATNTCEQQVAECRESLSSGDVTVTSSCSFNEENSGLFQACQAPIELFEKCIDQVFAEIENLVERADCSLKDKDLPVDLEKLSNYNNPAIPSCMELERQCPGILISGK